MPAQPYIPKRPRVELLPLIDMFFLLLAFFIFGVFSMTMQQGIIVDLPSAGTAASTQEDQVTISVTAEGALFVNESSATLKTLPAHLREGQQAESDPLVVIHADTEVRHGVIVSVLDIVRGAGLQRVSFRTEPERS